MNPSPPIVPGMRTTGKAMHSHEELNVALHSPHQLLSLTTADCQWFPFYTSSICRTAELLHSISSWVKTGPAEGCNRLGAADCPSLFSFYKTLVPYPQAPGFSPHTSWPLKWKKMKVVFFSTYFVTTDSTISTTQIINNILTWSVSENREGVGNSKFNLNEKFKCFFKKCSL